MASRATADLHAKLSAASTAHPDETKRPWQNWSATEYRHAFAAHWGDSTTTSSSDSPALPRGWPGEAPGTSAKYGGEPGRLFCHHPYLRPVRAVQHPRVVKISASAIPPCNCSTACCTTSPTCGSRSYTDTAGFTDHVFALMHLLTSASRRASATSASKLCVPQGVQKYRRCAR